MSDDDHGYETITPAIADTIYELHNEHPRLGHGGLMHLLTDAGYDVDSHELKRFMKQHKIRGDRWTATWRNAIRPWWRLGGQL